MCVVQYVAGQGAVPIVLTAQPGGVALAAYLRDLAAGKVGPASAVPSTAERWAALRCLPHACEKASQVLSLSLCCLGVLQLCRLLCTIVWMYMHISRHTRMIV